MFIFLNIFGMRRTLVVAMAPKDEDDLASVCTVHRWGREQGLDGACCWYKQ